MVTAPIDLLKIRFQLETATKPDARTYKTIAHSIQQIYKQEGLTVCMEYHHNFIMMIGVLEGKYGRDLAVWHF